MKALQNWWTPIYQYPVSDHSFFEQAALIAHINNKSKIKCPLPFTRQYMLGDFFLRGGNRDLFWSNVDFIRPGQTVCCPNRSKTENNSAFDPAKTNIFDNLNHKKRGRTGAIVQFQADFSLFKFALLSGSKIVSYWSNYPQICAHLFRGFY